MGPYHRASKTLEEKATLVKCAVEDVFLSTTSSSPFADWDDSKPWRSPRVQVRPAKVESLSSRMSGYQTLLAVRSRKDWLHEFYATDASGMHAEGVVAVDPVSKLVSGVFVAEWFVE